MRSPINGIIGMSTCLLEGFLSEEQRKYAKGIFETSRSLLTSVHDTLGISKRRSGYMDVESTPFSAPLPERKQHTAAVRSSSSTAKHVAHQPTVSWLSAPLPESRVHILLVEDNRVNRIVMTKLADKFGYQISSVENGQEALDYLCRSSRQPRPRAVLMDCSLAPIDGYETTRRIRQDRSMFDEETRSLPIIGLTVGARESDVEKCWSAGMDDRLSKPIGSKVYQKTLAKWTIAKRSHKLGHLMDAKL
jgi:CheY-like chemotaxis protein